MLDIVLVSFGLAASLSAQATAPQMKPAYAGDCSVFVTLADQRVGDLVQVQLDRQYLTDRRVSATGQPEVEVPTVSPLQKGQMLRLMINGSQISPKDATVLDSGARPAGVKPSGTCTLPEEPKFQGVSFYATAYYGQAFDNFAPDSVGAYPPNTATSRHNRQLFGVDFDYRMFGTDQSKVQLWLAGETLHGVRSADVDCKSEEKLPASCNEIDPQTGMAYAKDILTNQSSLEAYAAPRLEFAHLQKDASTPTTLYATVRLGFIALAEKNDNGSTTGGSRVYKNHHAALGLLAKGGPFLGSYFEVGWGMNELLGGRKFNRLKVDGFLTFSLARVPGIGDKANFFIEMFIDNDLKGTLPDSVQTFMGFDVDVRKFFGGE